MHHEFVHLRLHSEYSLVDGLIQIKPLMKRLQALNMNACALTDEHNLFAAIKFYKAATENGIKPIFGADLYIEAPETPTKPHLLTLLCQNSTGYKHLLQLISRAYTEGQLHTKPQIKLSWLEGKTEGLIALSGGVFGNIARSLLADKYPFALEQAKQYENLFPNRFYLELQRTKRPQEEDYIHKVLEIAETLNLPVVATQDVRFLEREDYEAHEARICIHEGFTLSDTKRPKTYSEEQYLKSPAEMIELFSDIPEAIENTLEIAKKCNLEIELGKTYFPIFQLPENTTVEAYLRQKAHEGFHSLKNISAPDIYLERLERELDVIISMGFAGYFLIVADFIDWSKSQKIPVGPGRGSGAGSLVAYALGITGLDPLEYALLFERFLNPERVSLPDFDIDFCMDGRDRVIDYVAQKYGRESVSQIITFGTMAAKAVVRDVGRVLSHPYGFVDKIAKLIPFELGITLDKALEQEEELRKRYESEEEVKTLIDLAKKLEGLTKNAGKHAGGVVIAPSPLTDFTALYCEAGETHIVSQFDKDDVEAIGLVKFDFLGLRTLTIIQLALDIIHELNPDKPPIDISEISLQDEATFHLLKSCQTTAVFQLESRGMRDIMKRLEPDCFEDIIALVALFRPGPLQSGMVDDFINRKQGTAVVEYPHPSIIPVLKPTYGVILYQEQVMQIAQELAGYTLGGADLLRRAMGKKKPEEMAQQRSIFISGAVEKGVKEETAAYIFDLMEKFAGYGFNKSHSAAYALLAYQTAWLKTHYPAVFMCAVLSSDMDHTDKVVHFVEECKRMGLTVLPPDINKSEYKFKVESHQTIRYGLGAIKGVGQNVVELMVQERKQSGDYLDLIDLCKRMDLKKLNRRVFEALIRSGSFDSLKQDRAVMFASLDNIITQAEQYKQSKQNKQFDMFSDVLQTLDEAINPWIKAQPWSHVDRLNGEKETIGFYLTGHPLDPYREELKYLTTVPIAHLKSHQTSVTVGGLLSQMKKLITKQGKRMASLVLDDGTGRLEVTVFPESYELYQTLWQADALLIVQGKLGLDNFSGNLRLTLESALSLDDARKQHAKSLNVIVGEHQLSNTFIPKLQQILQEYPGNCPILVEYQHADRSIKLNLPGEWRVRVEPSLLDTLKDLFGETNIQVVY